MSIPQAPWQKSKPSARKPVKEALTRERIVDAAMDLVVAEGYDAVSMRRVAQALQTGAASLYAHVANKQELDQLMLDRVAAQIEVPDPVPDKWQEQVIQVMHDLLATMRRYPGVARAAIGQIPLAENSLLTTERMIAILRAGGVPDWVVAYAVDLIPLYVCAVAFEEYVQQAAQWSSDDVEKYVTELAEWFRSLPADRFPNIVALAGALTSGDGDQRFAFGTRVIVAGLASFVPREGQAG
jgi:AcrR family transcriptional regulator